MIMKLCKIMGTFVLAMIVLIGCNNNSPKTGKDYYNDGIQAYKNGTFELAEENMENAVSLTPGKVEYNILYGLILVETKKHEEAIDQFNKVILPGNNKAEKQNNKKAYRGKGIAYYGANMYKEAIESFEEALKIDELEKLNMDILYYKGDAEEMEGMYEEAKETFTQILENDENQTLAYAKRGQMQLYLGNDEEGVLDFDKGIELNKSEYELYYAKYFLLKGLDKLSEAREVLNQALKLKVKSMEDHFNVAKIQYLLGDYVAAKPGLVKGAEEGFSAAYYYLGEIALGELDYESAITNYEKYIDLESNIKSAEVYNQLGLCYLEKKEYEKALNMFQIGIRLRDNISNQALMFNEIVAYEKLAQFDEALEKSTIYLEEYPDDSKMVREYEFIKSRNQNKKK
jgi:tetratricopeptide (TPR) repeat protein